MRKGTFVFLAAVLAWGCTHSKEIKKDLVTGLVTKTSELSCEDIYLTVNNEKTSSATFAYGDNIYMVFNDVKGFNKENGNVFPLMEILITGDAGDTALYAGNLYSEFTGGMNYTPLQLVADITVASPIRQGGKYHMNVIIKDRKGTGILSSKLDFSVEADKNIITETNHATCDAVYLFSEGNNRTINNGRISLNDNIYIMAEGVKGFRIEKGMVFPGVSLKGTDSEGNVIFDYPDLFTQYETSGIDASDFEVRVSSKFKVTSGQLKNPLYAGMTIWDKKSDAKIRITTELTLE